MMRGRGIVNLVINVTISRRPEWVLLNTRAMPQRTGRIRLRASFVFAFASFGFGG